METNNIHPHSVHVIVNPAAGQEQPVLSIINRVMKEAEVDWEVLITKERGDGFRLARESIQAGVDLVIACGGDGTVTEVASGLRGSSTPLAILPAGTANVMAMELGIPLDLEQAARLAVQGPNQARPVDMGSTSDLPFILRVGVGLEARMVLETPRESKTRWGNLAYIMSGLAQIRNPEVAQYTLDLDGLHVEVEGITLFVANSMSVGALPGVKMVQGVDISDGLLDVVVIRNSDLPSLMAIATNSILKQETPPEPVLHWQAKNISVRSNIPQPAESDGEEMPGTPFDVQIMPEAVIMVAPPAPPARDENENQTR